MIRLDAKTREQVAEAAQANREAGAWVTTPGVPAQITVPPDAKP